MQNTNSQKALMETNPYPVITDEPTLGQPLSPAQQMTLVSPYANQGYQNYNQPPPYLQPYPQSPQQQGFKPMPQGQYLPPPPPPQQAQVVLKLPNYISAAHPHYRLVVEQCNMPCMGCSYRGVDFVSMEPGCAAFSWAVCLFFFTGFLCCWVPFVCDGCKDITIRCSRCRRTKYIIQKPCC